MATGSAALVLISDNDELEVEGKRHRTSPRDNAFNQVLGLIDNDQITDISELREAVANLIGTQLPLKKGEKSEGSDLSFDDEDVKVPGKRGRKPGSRYVLSKGHYLAIDKVSGDMSYLAIIESRPIDEVKEKYASVLKVRTREGANYRMKNGLEGDEEVIF